MGAAAHDSRMRKCQVRDPTGQTGNTYAKRGTTPQIESPSPRTGNQEREPRKSRNLRLNHFDSDSHHSKNSQSHRKRARKPRAGVNAGSMASTENELETSNTSVSEEEQQPQANDEALGQNKLSLTERVRSPYNVDDNPTGPNLPAQPTSSCPISTEGK